MSDLPASLGDDHLSSQPMELGPQFSVLQVDFDVFVHRVTLTSHPCHPCHTRHARQHTFVVRRGEVVVAGEGLTLGYWNNKQNIQLQLQKKIKITRMNNNGVPFYITICFIDKESSFSVVFKVV